MGKWATQLILIALVGALIAWWLTRDPEPPRGSVRVDEILPERGAPSESAGASSSDRVEFRLPEVKTRKPAAAASPPPTDTRQFGVPKQWLLRGSASRNYELRSDRSNVFSGNASAILRSLDKEIQPNLTGSAVQAVRAAPYVGKRVQMTVAMRTEPLLGTNTLAWMYVTDPASVVIAYQVVAMRLEGERARGDWRRYRVVMDVPWHGEVLAYGFSIQGKGAVWVDDVRIDAVDLNVPLTGEQNSYQLGVIAQAVSAEGALANPSNLDFEDVQITRERQEGPPPDAINGTRF